MLTGLTTLDSLKEFWPAVVNEFPAAILDSQLSFYITRADILLNRVGTLVTSADNDLILEMAANMLVRRLIWADKHPATSSEPANVRSETVQGLSYARGPARTIRAIIGDEIWALLPAVVSDEYVTGMETELVFGAPLLKGVDEGGNRIAYFDPALDDALDNLFSERLLPGPYQGEN